MAAQLLDAAFKETSVDRERGDLVRRNVEVGGTEDKRLIALIAAAIDQAGCLGIGAGDDDSRHAHDVQLESGRIQTLDLLILSHQYRAALVGALLRARP